MKASKWGSHGSKVEKDSIDRATFWQKKKSTQQHCRSSILSNCTVRDITHGSGVSQP